MYVPHNLAAPTKKRDQRNISFQCYLVSYSKEKWKLSELYVPKESPVMGGRDKSFFMTINPESHHLLHSWPVTLIVSSSIGSSGHDSFLDKDEHGTGTLSQS